MHEATMTEAILECVDHQPAWPAEEGPEAALSERDRDRGALADAPESEHRLPSRDRLRARRILDQNIEYIFSPSFERPNADEEILAPPTKNESPGKPPSASAALQDRPAPPPGTPPYLADLYAYLLLTPGEERDLFRKMNFLKYRADMLRWQLDPDRPQLGLLDRIEQLLADALEIRNRIVRANLRLVVSIAKKLVDDANSLDELISDGNVPLVRAVEIFDFERGTRFSTYATWAIRNALYRSTPRNRRRQTRFRTGTQPVFESVSDDRDTPRGRESYHHHLQDTISRMLSRLDDRDQTIVKARFGLDDHDRPRKFREIAETLDISTERVRQLLNRSLHRLHEMAETEPLDAP